jgi:hypothetical protein
MKDLITLLSFVLILLFIPIVICVLFGIPCAGFVGIVLGFVTFLFVHFRASAYVNAPKEQILPKAPSSMWKCSSGAEMQAYFNSKN